jgi:hypothetical protein
MAASRTVLSHGSPKPPAASAWSTHCAVRAGRKRVRPAEISDVPFSFPEGIDPSNVTQLSEGGQTLAVAAGPTGGSTESNVELVDSEGSLDAAGLSTVGQQIGGNVIPIYAPVVVQTAMDVLTDVVSADHSNTDVDFFFDGTADNGPVDIKTNVESNVYEMRLEDTGQDAHYLKGVGTGGIPGIDLWNQITAQDLSSIESNAWNELLADIKANPNRTIDIVGFSRGAAEAVDFANRIENALSNGVFQKVDGKGRTESSVSANSSQINIRFLGLFDLVTSLGGQAGNDAGLMETIPAGIGQVAHAVALSEERQPFEFSNLQLLDPQNASPLTQVGFRGAHADIGGGYGADLLTAVTLAWMNGEASQAGWSTLDATKEPLNGSVPNNLTTDAYNQTPVHNSFQSLVGPVPWPRQYRNFPTVLDSWQPGNGWAGNLVSFGKSPQFWDPNYTTTLLIQNGNGA